MLDPHLNGPWRALLIAYGVLPIVAGFDKFTNLLTDWKQYLSPLATQWLPLSATEIMYAVGVIEITAGVLIFTRFTAVAAYIVSAWLMAIALNLLTTGHYFDIAARDLVLAVGAMALAKLTEARREPAVSVKRRRTRELTPWRVGV